MDLSRTALLLIDMQKESKYGIANVEEAVAAAVPLVDACRRLGVPVVYTRHVSRADAVGLPNDEVLDAQGKPVYYRSGTDAVEVIDELAPRPEDVVVDKHRWSGFHETPLDLMLRGLGVKHLIVGGFVTDGCLLTTVFDAYARDYQVNLVKDVCAATNSGSHKAAILMMANWVYDIEISSAAETVKKLRGEAYRSWTSSGPDQLQFTAETLDRVFAELG
ncbi:isochorismatase family protein [Planotetraspora phitsanulokensis]|uniref:Isochorismatase n=1 Tax=Planotetraspora phitsanulokensis TaxID=575192 RepID=A0A8J3U1I2_9ACTN|nr:isochorismatase family cysteine hydrolase [Planotetraspora phitsanulokensis]GII35641.1 isochorismatase [Planotetraspora phitsanulokensis]